MLKIAISRGLADEHPRFMAACARDGYAVDVFETTGGLRPAAQGQNGRPGEMPGTVEPELGGDAGCASGDAR